MIDIIGKEITIPINVLSLVLKNRLANVTINEEFDFWSFQAHERGVGETIKRNYCRSESLERERIFVQEAIVEPERSQI